MRLMRIVAAVVALAGVALLLPTVATADSGDDLINELMCPTQGSLQPLATSGAPEAIWMRSFIHEKSAEGWSKQRISDTLVRQYGERILSVPPKEGFGLAAWVMPLAALVGGIGIVSVMLAGWLRRREQADALLDAQVAEEMDEDELQRYEAQLAHDLEAFEY